jgi:hypothetical protein
MKARLIIVLALIVLILPLGLARATTSGCTPATDLFGCDVVGSGGFGLRVENTATNGEAVRAVGGSVGIRAWATGSNSTDVGVFGDSGYGKAVYGNSADGFAFAANGHAQQQLWNSGWVKALVRMGGSRLSRCFNSQTESRAAADSCNGFSIAGGGGNYTITFPFEINNRYLAITAESVADSPRCCMIQYDFPANNQVRVRTWDHNGAAIDRAFSLVVF